MYTITKIEAQKKDDKRSSVFINDQFDFGVTTKSIERYGLKEGMILNEEEYENLLRRIQLDKAKYCALEYLSRNQKTEKQIREQLLKHEYNERIIEEVVTFLKTYHYIDDMEFAKRYIESKAVYGRKSSRYIQSQLYLKGISQVNPMEVWHSLEEVEQENIIYFLDKYHYKKQLDYNQKRKIINRILNKGFSYEMIKKCIDKLDESFEV